MKLEDIQPQMFLTGIEASQPVIVQVATLLGPDAIKVIYERLDGSVGSVMLTRSQEEHLSLAEQGQPWNFTASGEDFRLGAEAYRIHLAHLFDPMMAVHTSNVEPLPHQITAVYEAMLPKQPLRYVLADDPGAGKTVMAGLLIKELLMRADAQRVLIVAPGGLAGQWADEMWEKFGLKFQTFDGLKNAPLGVNPWEQADLWLARLDQLVRNEDVQHTLTETHWDLVVFDEAHKLSANYFGNKVSKTRRYQFAEMLGKQTRHLLLMTATPHNGKEADFQLFMSLLDADRFYGKFRDGVHKVDVSDLMRRMVKEDLLKFDGTRLFPERVAVTASYDLSEPEKALYDAVTTYVREEMNRADTLNGKRKGTVGFALTSLQRRLASSPEAIFKSLERRRDRLQKRAAEERGGTNKAADFSPNVDWDEVDENDFEDFETVEEEVIDQATAALTLVELEAEIRSLNDLVEQARSVRLTGQDRKWEELRHLLLETSEMREASGQQRKLIIFTEHRDTLNYLTEKLRDLLGVPEAVRVIHGGTPRDERRKVQELFRNDPTVRILVATDAAGEGVNLQNAHLMVNYDLPWNPNRLEQRFGRIHRIGQTMTCHLWNLIAKETREGDVFLRLFAKLEVERQALSGRVFDILGEVFDNKSLRDLLIEAIRYGEDPARMQYLQEKVEGALDTDKLRDILHRTALCDDAMDETRVFAVREQMEKAEARKLQPHFIRAFFLRALELLGGQIRQREAGRYEITHVPAEVRARDRLLAGQERRNVDPVTSRYERVCFEKSAVRVLGKPDASQATLLHPGHPLMLAVIDMILERFLPKLKEGTVLVDSGDHGQQPSLLVMLDHAVKDGTSQGHDLSRRVQFVKLQPDATPQNAGWAPYLDLQPISAEDFVAIEDVLDAPWLKGHVDSLALNYASSHLVPEHFDEVRLRREQSVDKTLAAVRERLIKELDYQQHQYVKLQDDLNRGGKTELPLDNVRKTIEELNSRLKTRTEQLKQMRHVTSSAPTVIGAALVIPAGLIAARKGQSVPQWSADAAARAHVEKVAMQAVMQHQAKQGCLIKDVSADKCGWDVTATPPLLPDGSIPESRHIEVKGRAKGSTTVTVTKNEILYALNQKDKFVLALVFVDGDEADGPYYIRQPFAAEPDWAVTSINLELKKLLERAEPLPSFG